VVRLSKRSRWDAAQNRLSRSVEETRGRGEAFADLTSSDPTALGIEYPPDLSDLLVRSSPGRHRPSPRGMRIGREALAGWIQARGGGPVDANDLFLTTSTSEAYSWLFKILCDPGDPVLRFVPSYPLLDHLADLESVRLLDFPLRRDGRQWRIPFDRDLERAIASVRAAVVIHPNNPTGHYLSAPEMRELSALANAGDTPVISDEVFHEFGIEADPGLRAAAAMDCLTFSLGGLSKSCALPHWKLGWIRIGGPEEERSRAIEALDIVADTFLSPSAIVQQALPGLLAHSDSMRAQIVDRALENLRTIDATLGDLPALEREVVEGGWSAVLRVPRFEGEEEIAIDLLERGVLVHPGFLYDFPSEGRIVVSLIVEPETMREGMARVAEYFTKRCGQGMGVGRRE
jgi:alanine-synthesizing transaminase